MFLNEMRMIIIISIDKKSLSYLLTTGKGRNDLWQGHILRVPDG